MTTVLLATGCALLAFSPSLTLLLLVAYHKAHLIIVVTTSAFALLIASLLSSIVWLPFSRTWQRTVGNGGELGSTALVAVALIIPSVLCQTAARCVFVHLYHRVEGAIAKSIRAHERQQRERGSRAGVAVAVETGASDHSEAESIRLRLELNDWSCGIAAGVGYGGMHALMLYGTLLTSEADGMGTLYQSSCSVMPSLVNSAILAFLFSLLDIVLMLLTFYGMRRLQVTPLTKTTGRAAIVFAGVTHATAGLSTLPNTRRNGCLVALPLLSAIVLASWLAFAVSVAPRYLSDTPRNQVEFRDGSSIIGRDVNESVTDYAHHD